MSVKDGSINSCSRRSSPAFHPRAIRWFWPVAVRPPEDVGGLSGYYQFLRVMKDPKHPQHEDMLEWVGGNFDPTIYNASDIDRAFHGGWGAAGQETR
jgi:hypothetical protein